MSDGLKSLFKLLRKSDAAVLKIVGRNADESVKNVLVLCEGPEAVEVLAAIEKLEAEWAAQLQAEGALGPETKP